MKFVFLERVNLKYRENSWKFYLIILFKLDNKFKKKKILLIYDEWWKKLLFVNFSIWYSYLLFVMSFIF